MKSYIKILLRLLGNLIVHILSTIWHYIRMYVRGVLKRLKDAWKQDGDHSH